MRITVVGAGNVGTQLAVHCAELGHQVTVFSSNPERIQKHLWVINEKDEVIHSGDIEKATFDEEEAFQHAELVFVTMPAPMMKINAQKIEPYANPDMKICLVPGTGGGEWAFKNCIDKGALLFGVQRVPSVARLVEYGKVVRAVGYRDQMFVAAIPGNRVGECRQIVESISGIPTISLTNYLNISLTPSNPVLHTTRLRILFDDYYAGRVYNRIPYLYEEWDDKTSELLLQCDDEVQTICEGLNPFDLSFVKPLREYYESPTPEAMTKKIRSIKGFKGLLTPMVKEENGYVPDFSSRCFVADFSYGLAILIQIAELLNIDVPYMRNTMEWYAKLIPERDEFSLEDYEINTIKDFVSFYEQ